MKPLTIYKASAGSGKTFTLATEYIKLLIKNPNNYRNTLAVTFTNKATEEMKMRILSQLYGIWKKLPDSESYTKEITDKLGISRETASRQAGIALSYLIHNYNYFRVETIDAFFQSVLRNLARELDLTANLRIELNDTQIEEQAVDQLIESLNSTSIILKWLISYIESNISDNKSWNVIGQIKTFGATIFKDYYKNSSKALNNATSNKDFYKNYTQKLRVLRDDAKKKMEQYAERFEKETLAAGLETTSYSGKKSGIGSYFNKLKGNDFSDAKCVNSTLKKCLESADNWTSKSSPDKERILSLVNGSLLQLLRDAENDRNRQWQTYVSADVTLRHLNKLRLLNSIEDKVHELNNEANRFLLSDTQHLLHSLIKDTDSPFIFEKIGSQLEHVMIDEFQDTSSIQWQNFKTLLKECMSHGSDDEETTRNLIVGDVKQSIYRWRSGDWRLLNNIEQQFDNPDANLEIRSLQTNYRSERNIIEFNNAFFSVAAKKEFEEEKQMNEEGAKQLALAYSDVCQSIPEKKESNGYVKITMLDDDDYDKNVMNSIIDTVDELISRNIPLKKIAILIRYNRHMPLIASYFMKMRPEITIVSNEAFLLDASIAVTTIIQALRLLSNPDDALSKACLAITYQRTILGKDITDNDILLKKDDAKSIDEYLPDGFIGNIQELIKKPLFNIIEEIFIAFKLNMLSNQGAYISAFYDSVSKYITDNSGNLDNFIKEWDDTIHKKSIQSDEIDGIRLISIHKSKGLEFDNVIIPYCDWSLENTRNNTLWCNPNKAPFNELPIVPIDYSSKLMDTIYAEAYRDEHLQNCVDNLNLLYVAFTRASKNLFVIGKKKGEKIRSYVINLCFPELKDMLSGSNLYEQEDEPTIFEY
ncbi:MAG: UvrD-helicase domain-containing protein [Prevotellaceae bacterium]|nr:UvrD-helicase domain-containing protein [Prevotellaceae bacterium]